MRTRWWVAGIVAGVLLVSGCSADSGDSTSGSDAVQSGERAGAPAKADPGGVAASTAPVAGEDGRLVVVVGSMTLTVDDPQTAAKSATGIVTASGGRVDDRSETAATPTRAGRAELTLRIPTDRLEAVLDQLEALGVLGTLETNATDVTTAARDVDARIKALQTSVDRLVVMLASADKTSDLIAIEQELSNRQGNLESLVSQREQLAGQVALSTIRLSLSTEAPPAPKEEGPQGFWSGVVSGWNGLVATLTTVTIVVGVLLPWLIFVGLIGAGAWWAARNRRARRRDTLEQPRLTDASDDTTGD